MTDMGFDRLTPWRPWYAISLNEMQPAYVHPIKLSPAGVRRAIENQLFSKEVLDLQLAVIVVTKAINKAMGHNELRGVGKP